MVDNVPLSPQPADLAALSVFVPAVG